MFNHESLVTFFGLVVFIAPVALLGVLAVSSLLERPLSETAIGRCFQVSMAGGLLAALAILALMLVDGTRHESIELGRWVVIPQYHLAAKLTFDRLSVPLVILSFAFCGTISAFATRYMHHEPGFNRFFVLYALFVVGMVL